MKDKLFESFRELMKNWVSDIAEEQEELKACNEIGSDVQTYIDERLAALRKNKMSNNEFKHRETII